MSDKIFGADCFFNISTITDSTIEKKQDTTFSQPQAAQLNMKGVFLHVLGDALGSVVVLVSALTIYFAEVCHWTFSYENNQKAGSKENDDS